MLSPKRGRWSDPAAFVHLPAPLPLRAMPAPQTAPVTMSRPSPDATILVLLCGRPQATAAAIGTACRMTPGEVRARLAGLESQRLVVGRHDMHLVSAARVFAVTGEGRRKVER